MRTPPAGLTARQARIWQAAATIQGDEPDRPVGIAAIRSIVRLGVTTVYAEVETMEAKGQWPFPRPMRGGWHKGKKVGPIGPQAARDASDRMALLQDRHDRASRYAGEDRPPGTFGPQRELTPAEASRRYLSEWKRGRSVI